MKRGNEGNLNYVIIEKYKSDSLTQKIQRTTTEKGKETFYTVSDFYILFLGLTTAIVNYRMRLH